MAEFIDKVLKIIEEAELLFGPRDRSYELLPPRISECGYRAALLAVSPILAKNKFVIKELRARQPHLSKIDETLLVEVAGIEHEQARILCADFESSWLVPSSWSEYATQGKQLFSEGFRSIWDEWKSG